MDLKESIRQEISVLERQLKARKKSLLELEIADRPHEEVRFFMMRPLKAIYILLEENGGKMKRDDLLAALKFGGIDLGRKRKGHNSRISLDLSIANGNLILDKEYVMKNPDRSIDEALEKDHPGL